MTTTQTDPAPVQLRITEKAIPVLESDLRDALTMLLHKQSTVSRRAPELARQCQRAADGLKRSLEAAGGAR